MPKKKIIDLTFAVTISAYIGLTVFILTNPILWQEKTIRIFHQTTAISTTKFPPTEVKIGSIKLDLSISPGLVDGNTWDMYDDKIAWLATSAVPRKGNVILYGHDRRGLFGDLYKLKQGDVIGIKAGNSWMYYKVTELHRVFPTDINSIISSQDRLTLYTCDGTFDQKRLVVYAKLY